MEKKISEDYDGSGKSLIDAWSATSDVVIIKPGDTTYLPALQKAYKELYLPEFSPEDGYDSYDKWIAFMTDPTSPIEYRIIVAGNNIRNVGDDTVVKGICVGMYFKDSDVGYLGYVVVDPAFRTEGLGNALFKKFNGQMLDAAQTHGKPLSGLFLDCNNPAYTDHIDTYDPQKRLDKYIKWGGKVVECSYALPSLAPPPSIIDYLNLVSFPHPLSGSYASNKDILGLIAELYHDNGVADPAAHPSYQKMLKELDPKGEFNAAAKKTSREVPKPKPKNKNLAA